MDKLQAMQLFVRVVDSGSFTAAADQMDISRALASKLIQTLEENLGVRLLNRTTRRLSLTEPGQNYYQRISELLASLAEAEAEAAELQVEPRGKLRVTAPMSFAIGHLAPAIAEFQKRYPRVEVELELNDRQVDLVQEGYDMAIRISRLADSSLVARRIAPARLALAASPAYLAARGNPRHPDELAAHTCLIYTLMPRPHEWTLVRKGETFHAKVSGVLAVNNGDFLLSAAIAGLGIVLTPTFIGGDALRDGRLVRVLPEWEAPATAIHAVYPQTRALPAKTRLLIDFLVERYSGMPYWDRGCVEAPASS